MFLSVEMQTPPRNPARGELGQAAAWEATVAAALTPALSSAEPAEVFVAHLGRQLAETARGEAQAQKLREQQLRVAGMVGGAVSLLGGLVVWLVWRQAHKPDGKPGWSWAWKPQPRAHLSH